MGCSPCLGQSGRPLSVVHTHFPCLDENKVFILLDGDANLCGSRLLCQIGVSSRCMPCTLGIVLPCPLWDTCFNISRGWSTPMSFLDLLVFLEVRSVLRPNTFS